MVPSVAVLHAVQPDAAPPAPCLGKHAGCYETSPSARGGRSGRKAEERRTSRRLPTLACYGSSPNTSQHSYDPRDPSTYGPGH